MIKNYIDIQTNLGIARFDGNSILFVDTKTRITREKIKKIKFRFYCIILITVDKQKIKIRFNRKLAEWLEPTYLVRWFVISIIFLSAFLFSSFKLNFENFLICLFYAIMNTLLTFFFFFYLLKKTFKESLFSLSSLYALLNLPLLLYLPLSLFFWCLFISGYGVFLVFMLFSRKSSLPGKVFLGFIWILLLISTYSWFITILKLSFDSKLEVSLKQEVDFDMDKKKISWGKTIWKKPIFWNWNRVLPWNSFFLGKEIIFQIQPIKPVVLLHRPEQNRFAWLAFSKLPAQEILAFIPFYLKNQKHLIWAKFLNHSPVSTVQILKNKTYLTGYIQSYLFFDFNTQKEVILYFLAVSLGTKDKLKSLIWCIKQDSQRSMEYTFDQVFKGLSHKKD